MCIKEISAAHKIGFSVLVYQWVLFIIYLIFTCGYTVYRYYAKCFIFKLFVGSEKEIM